MLFLSFTCEDIGVAILTKMITIAMATKSLKNYLDVLLYDRNHDRSPSEIFGYIRNLRKVSENCSETFVLWKIFGNIRKVVGNLRKIVKNVRGVISKFM